MSDEESGTDSGDNRRRDWKSVDTEKSMGAIKRKLQSNAEKTQKTVNNRRTDWKSVETEKKMGAIKRKIESNAERTQKKMNNRRTDWKSVDTERSMGAIKRKIQSNAEKTQKKVKRVREENVEKWQMTVAKKLRRAEERRMKGYGEQSYGWFKFVRDLLSENNKLVPFKVFKKKAYEFYDSKHIEDISQKEFIKYLFAKMDKHPKFNVDTENSRISWVESRAKRVDS